MPSFAELVRSVPPAPPSTDPLNAGSNSRPTSRARSFTSPPKSAPFAIHFFGAHDGFLDSGLEGVNVRWVFVMAAATVAGCVTHLSEPWVAADRHAANIAAAEDAGYKVVANNGRTLFCATEVATGSHIMPCITESEWERAQQRGWQGSSSSAPSLDHVSGRTPYAGTIGR